MQVFTKSTAKIAKYYIGETSRNLNKRIYEHKKDFKTGDTNSLVSHNILTKYTFDFQNSAMFAFIHDKSKRIIIEACSIVHPNTILQWQGFFKIGKIILKEFKIHTKD